MKQKFRLNFIFKALIMLAAVASTMRPVVASSTVTIMPYEQHSDTTTTAKDTTLNDTITIAIDSLSKATKDSTENKEPLEAPVYYESNDSMVWIMGGNANLYGKGNVKYENIELDASVISMNMDSSVVHAFGSTDSTGNTFGLPVFKDGNTPYESDKIKYNFKSKKGVINNVYTQQGDGFMMGTTAKKDDEGAFYLRQGKYTTCDAEHPHWYINLTRAKVRPKKDAITGPAYFVVEDVPLPLAIPFGFFPFTDSYSSGFIMPSYGDDSERGFYLKDGGYYFAISDKMDLRVTGELFTKGSWGVSAASTYTQRYKYSGSFDLSYLVTKEGERNLPDYSVGKNFRIQWSHRQDAKASPSSNFSASVNFATSSFEKSNIYSIYNPMLSSQSVRTSSVSYSKTFSEIGLTISSTFNASQNIQDSTVALTFPSLNVSLARFYPLKRKRKMGEDRWYEKISLSYSGQMSNSISTKEDKLFKSNIMKDWRNGFKHNIPISATFQFFDYINVTPSFNYTERWYAYKVNQFWDERSMKAARDTVYGFNRVYNYNMSLGMNTTLYGFYQPAGFMKNSRVHMVRHVFKPSVSFSYAPDFGASRYGYYDTYTYTDEDGEVHLVEYSPYNSMLYGVPGRGKTGSVSLDVSNNVEMKWRTKNDSLRKVSIIDELGASISYNLAAKQKQWSNLGTRLRLKLSKSYTFSMNATWATYAYTFNENGQVIEGNRTEWSYGRFGRFQGMSQNISYTFNNGTFTKIASLFGKKDKKEEKTEMTQEELAAKAQANREAAVSGKISSASGVKPKGKAKDASVDEDGYMPFKLPWNFTVSYGITMSEDRSAEINIKTMRYPYKFTQNMNFSGNIGISDGWKINYTSGYNFENKKLTTTTMNLSRDLHCFEMTCGIVLSPYTSFNFSFRATSQMLADALKWDKRNSGSNIEWY
ncbi:MAG: LPS-assembly protein LptD [Bacteroidaceae bacterium]|nr:LPS-assembly protein LptD [Bacteroidaceae bacterium]